LFLLEGTKALEAEFSCREKKKTNTYDLWKSHVYFHSDPEDIEDYVRISCVRWTIHNKPDNTGCEFLFWYKEIHIVRGSIQYRDLDDWRRYLQVYKNYVDYLRPEIIRLDMDGTKGGDPFAGLTIEPGTAITQADLTQWEGYIADGNRTAYYLEFFAKTGNSATLLESAISQFSGAQGGTAMLANAVIAAEHDVPPIQPFSELVARGHFSLVRREFGSERATVTNHGRILADFSGFSNPSFLLEAHRVWKEDTGLGDLGNLFPGNPLAVVSGLLERCPISLAHFW